MRRSAAALLVATAAFNPAARAANWPQWRGPALNGSSPEKDLPVEWGTEKNVAWKTPMPGPGASTPVIWGDRVFVSSSRRSGDDLRALCLDASTGKILWDRPAGKNRWYRAKRHNAASPSPVTDGSIACFYFGTGTLRAFDFAGAQLWRRELEREYGVFEIKWGYGSSPLLYEGRLYIPVLQCKKPGGYGRQNNRPAPLASYLLAIDLKTGKTLWKHDRPTDATGESTESYITPLLFRGGARPSIVLHAGEYVTAHRLADGGEIWRWQFTPHNRETWQRTVSSAVADANTIYAGRPKCRALYALRPGDRTGTLTDDVLQWTFVAGANDATTPLLYGGKLYLLNGLKKTIHCLAPETGTPVWSGALGVKSPLRASPTGADGKIYCISMRGAAVVLAAGESCRILAVNRMNEKDCLSTIAVAGGKLFIRTPKYLYCIGSD